MHSRVVEWIVVLVFTSSLAPTANAQDDLFKSGTAGVLTQRYPLLRQILDLPTTINAEVGTLAIDLAKATDTVTFKYGATSTKLKTTSWRQVGNAFSWSATGVDSPWESACLLVSNKIVTGAIYTMDGVFSIDPIGDDLHSIVRFDPTKLPPDHPRGASPLQPAPVSAVPTRRPAPVPVHVLVAFAKGATQMHADPAARRAWVDDVINVTNCSYRNSGIDVELVRSDSSPYLADYQERGFTTDLNLLMGKNDGVMEDIHSVRIADKADVVVLIVGRAHGFCGRAATTLTTKEQAFAMVRLDCAKGKLTLAHEIGHLQGASHQDEVGKFPYAHAFCKGGRGTVMSSGCGVRYPQWSRPPDLGSESSENNVRVLNSTADIIGGLLP